MPNYLNGRREAERPTTPYEPKTTDENSYGEPEGACMHFAPEPKKHSASVVIPPRKKRLCTDCFMPVSSAVEICSECTSRYNGKQPLHAKCARYLDDKPMCSECAQVYIAERLKQGREKKEMRERMMRLHDETIAALREVA
jgi:hypothetical protein